MVPMQPDDMTTMYVNATALEHDFGFTPKIKLREGLRKFAKWYNGYDHRIPFSLISNIIDKCLCG